MESGPSPDHSLESPRVYPSSCVSLGRIPRFLHMCKGADISTSLKAGCEDLVQHLTYILAKPVLAVVVSSVYFFCTSVLSLHLSSIHTFQGMTKPQ